MQKTKIEWCDSTWNPVTGCRHGCDYCYARRIAERFSGYDPQYGAGLTQDENGNYTLRADERKYRYNRRKRKKETAPYPFGFEPTLYRYRLDQPKKWKEPRTVFVCSMADLFGDWVPDSWIHDVMDACYVAPQHRYLFLTKNPERYGDAVEYLETDVKDSAGCEIPAMWLGATAATNRQFSRAYSSEAIWVSIEPLLEEIYDEFFVEFYHDGFGEGERKRWEWIVIGAETGNRKGRVTPRKE